MAKKVMWIQLIYQTLLQRKREGWILAFLGNILKETVWNFLTHFLAKDPSFTFRKQESCDFFDVFGGYRKGTLAWNELILIGKKVPPVLKLAGS